MKVREIMTKDPACVTPETRVQDVARLMVDCDCGEIPVIDTQQSKKPIGVVTDRDIACRAVAEGRNPFDMTAKQLMTTPAVTVNEDVSVDDVVRTMEKNQIRRVPVVDQQGRCCGMVSQADLARRIPVRETGNVVREVSKPTDSRPE